MYFPEIDNCVQKLTNVFSTDFRDRRRTESEEGQEARAEEEAGEPGRLCRRHRARRESGRHGLRSTDADGVRFGATDSDHPDRFGDDDGCTCAAAG